MTARASAAFAFSLHLPDARATAGFGAALAAAIEPGTVVLLDGPLGAGKTTFVQGFARGAGAAGAASPSFVLAHSYTGGRMPIWHLDLYRIESETEIDDLDLEQYLPPDGVALVEWAAHAPGRWPPDRIEIALRVEGAGRSAEVSARGKGIAALRRSYGGPDRP